MVPADAGTMCRGNMGFGTGAEPVAVIDARGDGPRARPEGYGWPQNVGNGLTHLLRSRAIRATLKSPQGFDQIQL